jgi:hypothetical protein
MNNGSSNRLIYDKCAYQKQLFESVSPLEYRLYQGAHENCNKCTYDKFWKPYQLVDIETELKRMNRPLSKCDQFKYYPTCKKSSMCLNTHHKSVPIVFPPEVCPIVYNNIPRQTHPGFKVPRGNFCQSKKTCTK